MFHLFLQHAMARVFLYEAISRMMAGASPGKTQMLLDRSLRHRQSKSSVICGRSECTREHDDVCTERRYMLSREKKILCYGSVSLSELDGVQNRNNVPRSRTVSEIR